MLFWPYLTLHYNKKQLASFSLNSRAWEKSDLVLDLRDDKVLRREKPSDLIRYEQVEVQPYPSLPICSLDLLRNYNPGSETTRDPETFAQAHT